MFDFLFDDPDFLDYIENEHDDSAYCDEYGNYKE